MGFKEIIFGVALALILAMVVSPFASPFLDGLEKVAEDKGFLEKGEEAVLSSPIPDYVWPGIDNETVATSVAGMAGTIITLMVGWALAAVIKRS